MDSSAPLVCVLADDLIWASRLVAAVERSGATAGRASSLADLERMVEGDSDPAAVLIDLNGRRYDGVGAVSLAARSGRPILAVGQHEDVELRKRALAASAWRVYSYNKLFRDGPAVVSALIGARSMATQASGAEQ